MLKHLPRYPHNLICQDMDFLEEHEVQLDGITANASGLSRSSTAYASDLKSGDNATFAAIQVDALKAVIISQRFALIRRHY